MMTLITRITLVLTVFDQVMRAAASELHLKGHLVGLPSNNPNNPTSPSNPSNPSNATKLKGDDTVKNEIFLHSAGDIEGHKGYDGHYYLLDLARAFPAEAPTQCITLDNP